MASTSPTPTSLIRVSASGRSFDRTISELVSGSSWIAHRARGPPGPNCCGRAFLLRRSPEPCTGANRPATPPSYSHWYNVKRHLHIHSTLFCYTTLMFSPSLSLCYQVLHHPHIHGATIQFSTATLCCIYAAIAKCHSLIDSAILCYIVLHQPHTFIVVHGATTPSYS